MPSTPGQPIRHCRRGGSIRTTTTKRARWEVSTQTGFHRTTRRLGRCRRIPLTNLASAILVGIATPSANGIVIPRSATKPVSPYALHRCARHDAGRAPMGVRHVVHLLDALWFVLRLSERTAHIASAARCAGQRTAPRNAPMSAPATARSLRASGNANQQTVRSRSARWSAQLAAALCHQRHQLYHPELQQHQELQLQHRSRSRWDSRSRT